MSEGVGGADAARFASLPSGLRDAAKMVRLSGDIPALVASPDWSRPVPMVLWLHGRTAYKELDPGRYLRWLRAGLGLCAIDLPGHGERDDASPEMQKPARTLEVIARSIGEIDGVVRELTRDGFARAHAIDGATDGPVFDAERLAIGGMSLGGMIALRRLCDPHPFRCAAVEATTGWLMEMYHPGGNGPDRQMGKGPNQGGEGDASERGAGEWAGLDRVDPPHPHERENLAPLDPMSNLDAWRPIPLLAVHSEADALVPWRAQRGFLDRLRARYGELGADPALVEQLTWPETGAPQEHLGFGRFSNDSKNAQTAFLARHLLGA
ncbi:MAG: acetylxylan esterase [Phycisphaerales bacterium]|nr:acetylxylan esterase [Phycisphaerales bacterium]